KCLLFFKRKKNIKMIVSESIPKPLILVDRIFSNPEPKLQPIPKQSNISPRNSSKRGNSYSNQIAPSYVTDTSYIKPDPVPFGGHYQSLQSVQARQYSNGTGNVRGSNPKRTNLNKLLHNHNLRIREIFQYED